MTFILDTHAFLWWDGEPSRLSRTAEEICSDPARKVLLSYASIWEIQIKFGLGKLRLQRPLFQTVRRQMIKNGLRLLSIKLRHLDRLSRLSALHSDPFDRMLVAQAQAEGATLITRDPQIQAYPVSAIW